MVYRHTAVWGFSLKKSMIIRFAAKMHAKRMLLSNWAKCILVTLISSAFYMLYLYYSNSIDNQFISITTLDQISIDNPQLWQYFKIRTIAFGIYFLVAILIMPLRIGMYEYMFRLAKGQNRSVSDLFQWVGTRKRYFNALWLSVLINIIGILIAGVIAIPVWLILVGALGVYGGSLGGFSAYLSYALSLFGLGALALIGYLIGPYRIAAYLLAQNPEKRAGECIREAKKMFKGRRGELLAFNLSFAAWYIFSMLTVVFYFLFFIPYFTLATVNMIHLIQHPETLIIVSKPPLDMEQTPDSDQNRNQDEGSDQNQNQDSDQNSDGQK